MVPGKEVMLFCVRIHIPTYRISGTKTSFALYISKNISPTSNELAGLGIICNVFRFVLYLSLDWIRRKD